jgi:hypothetical protein
MKTGDGVDDRMMRQGKLMSWLFTLPLEPKSAVGSTLEQGVVQSLWDTLPHPDAGWMQFSGPQYRRADGEGNTVQEPQVGGWGRHIFGMLCLVVGIRSIEGTCLTPRIFLRSSSGDGRRLRVDSESILAAYRRTCSIWRLWSRMTCSIRISRTGSETRRRVMWICLGFMVRLNHICLKSFPRTLTLGTRHTGWNQELQDSVHDKASHRGKLYADVFADPLLDLQPPGVISMALLWCRNHNWIAEQLLIKSKDDPRIANIPKNDDKKGLERLDEHLLQTARNINVGTFVTVFLKDYVRMLLGINRENTTWTLPINQEFSATTKKDIPKPTGNQCSIEFNFYLPLA